MPKTKMHPALTPGRIAELSALAKKIDREEGDELRAAGRAILLRHETVKKLIIALKAVRLEKKLGLEEVGEKSGIGKTNLSRLENHAAPNPTIDTLLRYAEPLRVNLRVSMSQP